MDLFDENGNQVDLAELGFTDNSTIQDMRSKMDQDARDRKAEQKELEALRGFKAQQDARTREQEAQRAFESLGLNPTLAELYLAKNPDASEFTPEEVGPWAERYGFMQKVAEAEAPVPEQPAEPPPTFVPTTPLGGVQVAAPQGKISLMEYQAMVTNPATHTRALEMSQAGLVEGHEAYDPYTQGR